MIVNKNGQILEMETSPKPSTLILGQSRMGKTFLGYRLTEDAVACGKQIVIIDYSNSFAHTELKVNQFQFTDKIQELYASCSWRYDIWIRDQEMFIEILCDSLKKGLDITSFQQIRILEQICTHLLTVSDCFTFSSAYTALENLQKEKTEDTNRVKMIDFLLQKIYPLKKSKVSFGYCCPGANRNPEKSITLFQLSDLTEDKKRILFPLLSELLVAEIIHNKESSAPRYEVFVWDEFQMILKKDSALSWMLRQGGKYNVYPILISQYTAGFDSEMFLALMQVQNKFYFRTTGSDADKIAEQLAAITSFRKREWIDALSSLKRGEAIFQGCYHYKGKRKTNETPLIVKVQWYWYTMPRLPLALPLRTQKSEEQIDVVNEKNDVPILNPTAKKVKQTAQTLSPEELHEALTSFNGKMRFRSLHANTASSASYKYNY